MPDDFLGDRQKALEDSFFAKQNAELIERMRAEKAKLSAKEGLEKTSGIRDEAVLARLVELKIGPETWAALSLVPLVEVAWADGVIADPERRAILSAAETQGVAPGSATRELLESWLGQRPEHKLLETWGAYTVDLCSRLSESERSALESEVLGRARDIASAAGGMLGFGKISQKEETVLAELAHAFRKD